MQLSLSSLLGLLAAVGGVAAAGPGDADTVVSAITALNTFYNTTTGLWGNETAPWWHSGVSLRVLTEYMLTTGSKDYVDQATYVVDNNRAPLNWWPEGDGDFRADSTDDTGWWALALVDLYQITGDETYLNIAKEDEAYMYSYWNTTTCNGGLIWSVPTLTYHNAISNELYLELTASLHNAIPGDTQYLERAMEEWKWFNASGMINSDWLVNDGLTEDSACTNNGMTTWTYNQGVLISGLVQLNEATGDATYLDTAQNIADAVVNSDSLSPGGILTEAGCPNVADCEPNGTSFKGTFIRGLAKLNAALGGDSYTSYINKNAQSLYDNARQSSTDYYGFEWQGPFDGQETGKQASAINLLMSTL